MYFLIGICLLFAYLYTVNLAGSLLISAGWHLLAPLFERLRPSTRGDILFFLRIAPVAAAVAVAVVFVLPSFVLYEPAESNETISLKMTVVVAIAALGMILAAARILFGWWRTRRLLADWMRTAEPLDRAELSLPAFKIRHPFPIIAVVGNFRPRVFVAAQVLDELNENEFAAALAHETAHIGKRDNLRRVIMGLCSDLLILPLSGMMDRRWTETTESAADEFAAQNGSSHAALHLASALVKIGRLAPAPGAVAMPSAAYLVDPAEGPLASRIEHLIEIEAAGNIGRHRFARLFAPVTVLPLFFAAIALPFALNPNVLLRVHQLTESVFAVLQ